MVPYKKTILIIFQITILLFFAKILHAAETFDRLSADLSRHLSLQHFERDDWLRFSATCSTYRRAFVRVVLGEIKADQTQNQRFLNVNTPKQYATLLEALEAFRKGDPHVVRVISHLFPDMCPTVLHRALRAQSKRKDVTPAEQAQALYHLALMRIEQRTTDECTKLFRAYDNLREVCRQESSLSDDLKRQGIYYMAKTQSQYELYARYQDWRPAYSWSDAFNILSRGIFYFPPLEMLERNFLIAALRIEGKISSDCMTRKNAVILLSQTWKEFSNILASEDQSPKKKARVLRFKFDFLMRTRNAFFPFTSNVPVMPEAWTTTLTDITLLLKPPMPLLPKTRADLREKKLTLLINSSETQVDLCLKARDLLEEFLEGRQDARTNLSLVHRAESAMINIMETLATTIYAQPEAVLSLLRKYLVTYTPSAYVSEAYRTYGKTDIFESLLQAVEPLFPGGGYRTHSLAPRKLFLERPCITRRKVLGLLVEAEILAVMNELDSLNRWRDLQLRHRFCQWLQDDQNVGQLLSDDAQRKKRKIADDDDSSINEEGFIPALPLQSSNGPLDPSLASTLPLDQD